LGGAGRDAYTRGGPAKADPGPGGLMGVGPGRVGEGCPEKRDVLMAIIEKEIELVGLRGRKRVRGLFDSGATYSCIGRELAEALEILTPLAEPMSFETAERGRTLRPESM